MARMTFREPNMMKWVGVRPAHNGEQVIGYGSVANGYAVLYTVPAGGIFYLTFAHLVPVAVAAGFAVIYLMDATSTAYAVVAGMFFNAAGVMVGNSSPFTYPIEVPEGHIIKARSSAAGLTVVGTIVGWID
jgi:hypothetical protein